MALVEGLQGQELEIRYDQVVLQIGDSLIRRLSDEIADGDFLIAIVSPDSVSRSGARPSLLLREIRASTSVGSRCFRSDFEAPRCRPCFKTPTGATLIGTMSKRSRVVSRLLSERTLKGVASRPPAKLRSSRGGTCTTPRGDGWRCQRCTTR